MKPIIALDIETTGTNPWKDEIHMCGLFDGKDYLAVREPALLGNLLTTVFRDHNIVGHRTDFDIKFLLVKEWISPASLAGRVIHDTRILGSLVKHRVPKEYLERYEVQRKELNKILPKGQSHREGSPLSLKVMAPWYLKVSPFWETPGDHNNEAYNEKDCRYTYQLFNQLAPRLRAEGSWAFYEKLLEWTKMLREMEMRGICIDMNELDKVEAEYLEKRVHLKNKLDEIWLGARIAHREMAVCELHAHYQAMSQVAQAKAKDKDKTKLRYDALYEKALAKLPTDINYASPVQMAWLLKDYLGLDIEDMDGEESTGKAVLHRLAAEEGREDIQTFLDWREADKVLTMYVPTYRELQHDSVIHPSFNLTGTRTGRTSSSGPNLQQVPSKLYRLFRPRLGYSFVQYDLSGIEAALIALYSGDKRLYEILEKGESIHDHNAKAMFGLECDVNRVADGYPKERKTVKNIGFACFYGAGWKRISKVFAAGGFPITDQQAKDKLALLKSYYPQVFEFHREITETFERGETVVNLLGRPINLQRHENPYMQGFNTLIQSSASDLNLEACCEFSRNSYKGAQPLLVVHDFIMAESPTGPAFDGLSIEDVNAGRLRELMTRFNLQSVNGPIKLRVEGGVSDGWDK